MAAGLLILTRTNVASVGNVFNDTRKVKVLSLSETIKEKSTSSEGPSSGLHCEEQHVRRRFKPKSLPKRAGCHTPLADDVIHESVWSYLRT